MLTSIKYSVLDCGAATLKKVDGTKMDDLSTEHRRMFHVFARKYMFVNRNKGDEIPAEFCVPSHPLKCS